MDILLSYKQYFLSCIFCRGISFKYMRNPDMLDFNYSGIDVSVTFTHHAFHIQLFEGVHIFHAYNKDGFDVIEDSEDPPPYQGV